MNRGIKEGGVLSRSRSFTGARLSLSHDDTDGPLNIESWVEKGHLAPSQQETKASPAGHTHFVMCLVSNNAM